MIPAVKTTFKIIPSCIMRAAKGFLPKASTPVLAILPKYMNPITKDVIVTIAARRYRSVVRGDKSGAPATTFIFSIRFVLTPIKVAL